MHLKQTTLPVTLELPASGGTYKINIEQAYGHSILYMVLTNLSERSLGAIVVNLSLEAHHSATFVQAACNLVQLDPEAKLEIPVNQS